MGENIAITLLKKHGYRILETNFFASKWGEIDIIAKDGGCLVFVEVKTRRMSSGVLPEEPVSQGKINKIVRAAQFYIMTKGLEDPEHRIDVVALGLDEKNNVVYENLLKNISF